MKQLVNLIISLVLALVVISTAMFAYMQIKRSQTIDESLVSSLTTKLETALIQQVITKINQPH